MNISGKPVNIRLTQAASHALSQADQPVMVEMELYFSCLIRKRVRFQHEPGSSSFTPVADKLFVQFRPVMTRQCNKEYSGEEPPLTDFPIEDATPFVPKWLKIDYRKGGWQGEFGY